MFGNNAITSTWGQNNNNNQQQQQPGAFGQPSAFGSTGVLLFFRVWLVLELLCHFRAT